MGVYMSMPDCQSHYNITVDCSYNFTSSSLYVSGLSERQVQPDLDIVGVAVGPNLFEGTPIRPNVNSLYDAGYLHFRRSHILRFRPEFH